MRRFLPVAALMVTVAATGGWLAAAEPQKAAEPTEAQMMEMWAKAAAPGPQHEHLRALEGKWNLEVKMWMDPAAPPEVSTGTATSQMIMGGRYLREEVQGQAMGQPFQGFGITAYDNVLKKYISTWIDSMGTGIMRSEGTADSSGKTFNWDGTSSDPLTGTLAKSRMVTRVIDDKKHVFEMYMPGKDGKEFKTMEITYTRL